MLKNVRHLSVCHALKKHTKCIVTCRKPIVYRTKFRFNMMLRNVYFCELSLAVFCNKNNKPEVNSSKRIERCTMLTQPILDNGGYGTLKMREEETT